MKKIILRNYLMLLCLGIGSTMISMMKMIKMAQPINGVVGEKGIGLFYDSFQATMSSLMGVIVFYLPLFVIPLIYSIFYIQLRQNHGDYFIRLRYKKYSHYLGKVMLRNAGLTYLYYLCLVLTKVVIITIYYAPLKFYEQSSILEWSIGHFTTNGLWNFLIFVIALPLGYAIFGTFVFVVGLYMKSIIPYISSGFVLAMSGIILPAIVSLVIDNSWVVQMVYLGNILTPAVLGFGNTSAFSPVILYPMTAIFYLSMTGILFYYRMYLDKKGG